MPHVADELGSEQPEIFEGMDMVHGADEQEVEIRKPVDFDIGDLDQDYEFIQEEIDLFMHDIKNKVPVLVKVEQAMEKGKRKIPKELQANIISEVQLLEENCDKMLGYSRKSPLNQAHFCIVLFRRVFDAEPAKVPRAVRLAP